MHTDFKTKGGMDLVVYLHCAKWGGCKWDENGNETKPLTTTAEAQAYMKSVRERIAKESTRILREAEAGEKKEEANAVKAAEAAAAATKAAAAKTKAAEQLKEKGGDEYKKAVEAQKEAQRVAAAKRKEVEDAKAASNTRETP